MALLCDPQRWPLHTAGWGPALPPVPLALRAFPAEIASSHAALAGSPSLGRAGRGGAGGGGTLAGLSLRLLLSAHSCGLNFASNSDGM